LFFDILQIKNNNRTKHTQKKERKEKNAICGNCCCEGVETEFALSERAWDQ